MEQLEEFNFEQFKKEAISGLSSGKRMSGSEGVLAPLLKHLLESVLAGELEHHLANSKASGQANRKNGKTSKTVRSLTSGAFELEGSRDRQGTFEPKILPKRQLIITEELEGNVLSMYARGMSTRAISDYIQEIYAMEISAAEISRITDSVLPAVQQWRNRPLDAVYPFVFLDCIHYKVRVNGVVESRAIYNILGVDIEGKKDLLGLYVSENEGAGPEIKSHFRSVLAFRTDGFKEQRRSGYTDCLYRWLKRISGSDRGHLSPNPGAALHCPSD